MKCRLFVTSPNPKSQLPWKKLLLFCALTLPAGTRQRQTGFIPPGKKWICTGMQAGYWIGERCISLMIPEWQASKAVSMTLRRSRASLYRLPEEDESRRSDPQREAAPESAYPHPAQFGCPVPQLPPEQRHKQVEVRDFVGKVPGSETGGEPGGKEWSPGTRNPSASDGPAVRPSPTCERVEECSGIWFAPSIPAPVRCRRSSVLPAHHPWWGGCRTTVAGYAKPVTR